jgi:hypothetical protein
LAPPDFFFLFILVSIFSCFPGSFLLEEEDFNQPAVPACFSWNLHHGSVQVFDFTGIKKSSEHIFQLVVDVLSFTSIREKEKIRSAA